MDEREEKTEKKDVLQTTVHLHCTIVCINRRAWLAVKACVEHLRKESTYVLFELNSVMQLVLGFFLEREREGKRKRAVVLGMKGTTAQWGAQFSNRKNAGARPIALRTACKPAKLRQLRKDFLNKKIQRGFSSKNK